jgi:hypothetical protein
MQIEKLISPLIAYQFPQFYRDEGPDFIAFVTSYYEWMEQSGQVINVSREMLDYKDIDTTLDSFVQHFKNKYIDSLPENIVADKRLLLKHITDLYNAKGTDRGYRLLFRMLFNEDIDIYVPGQHLIKSSDSKWYVPTYIEVTETPEISLLIGKKIYTRNGGAAVVESTSKKIIQGKTVNIIYISSIEGEFKNGQKVLSLDVPAITEDNAPLIIGSLSTISVTSGGANYKVGDLLNVEGSGQAAIAQVVSTTNQNGKVSFYLKNGGSGYTVNAIVSITGGYGSGASANIGGITNKQTYSLVTDVINGLKDTVLEYSTQTMQLGVNSVSGTFGANNTVTSSANVRHLDVSYLSGSITSGESISNTALGITGITVYNSDHAVLYITGTDQNITNANLVHGITLISNVTNSIVKVNSTWPKVTVTSNGLINAAASNSTVKVVYNPTSNIGYFIPGSTITSSNSGATATVTSVTRTTDWGGFPAAGVITNLDTQLNVALNIKVLEVGTITYLKNINPGTGYSENPIVTITEPDIYNLRISDGKGGFLGYNAEVITNAGSSDGIVTAVKIVDSGYGYNQNETNILSSTADNPTSVYGTSIVETHGVGMGYFLNNTGFLSDTEYLQDSSFYQIFSYEIVASRMIDTYRKLVEDLVHPTGIALYGRYSFKSELTNQDSQPVYISATQN